MVEYSTRTVTGASGSFESSRSTIRTDCAPSCLSIKIALNIAGDPSADVQRFRLLRLELIPQCGTRGHEHEVQAMRRDLLARLTRLLLAVLRRWPASSGVFRAGDRGEAPAPSPPRRSKRRALLPNRAAQVRRHSPPATCRRH